ncbi:MAG: hypothetical protein ACREJ6_05080 [Candidatus Methylomirabilis sp.]
MRFRIGWLRRSLVRAYPILLVPIPSFCSLLRTSIAREHVAEPLAIAFASIGGLVLNPLSMMATRSGMLFSVQGFAAQIDEVGTGIFFVAIYVWAVVACPGSVRKKLIGLLMDASSIRVLNPARALSVMYVGRYSPDFFETAPLLVWQSLMILAALLVRIYWTGRFVGVAQD